MPPFVVGRGHWIPAEAAKNRQPQLKGSAEGRPFLHPVGKPSSQRSLLNQLFREVIRFATSSAITVLGSTYDPVDCGGPGRHCLPLPGPSRSLLPGPSRPTRGVLGQPDRSAVHRLPLAAGGGRPGRNSDSASLTSEKQRPQRGRCRMEAPVRLPSKSLWEPIRRWTFDAIPAEPAR